VPPVSRQCSAATMPTDSCTVSIWERVELIATAISVAMTAVGAVVAGS
jgi:hypothetical protein